MEQVSTSTKVSSPKHSCPKMKPCIPRRCQGHDDHVCLCSLFIRQCTSPRKRLRLICTSLRLLVVLNERTALTMRTHESGSDKTLKGTMDLGGVLAAQELASSKPAGGSCRWRRMRTTEIVRDEIYLQWEASVLQEKSERLAVVGVLAKMDEPSMRMTWAVRIVDQSDNSSQSWAGRVNVVSDSSPTSSSGLKQN